MSDAHAAPLAHHFETLEQQRETHSVGMWAFLAQEILFFGGLFAAYLVFRDRYPAAFRAGSHHLDVFWGTLNTGVLIASSLTMALAVRAAQLGRRAGTAGMIAATMCLALVFLGVKTLDQFRHTPGISRAGLREARPRRTPSDSAGREASLPGPQQPEKLRAFSCTALCCT